MELVLLVMFLLSPAFVLVGLTAFLVSIWRGYWRWLIVTPLVGFVGISVLVFWPTTSNLWPIALFIYGMGSLFLLGVLILVRYVVLRK